MSNSTDWISAVCSAIAAIVALITLLTVYVAAIHILQRRQAYQLGASKKSLGAWKSVVVSPSTWKMQTDIKTPIISVPRLIAQSKNLRFELEFSMPMGKRPSLMHMAINETAVSAFSTHHSPTNFIMAAPRLIKARASKLTSPDIHPVPTVTLEGELESGSTATTSTLAVTSWVNFLEALGLGPDHTGKGADMVQLQTQSDLYNGIVPMRWKGKDLVAICSILGFQSSDDMENMQNLPMILPTQWSGPLGWLQFRDASHGCVAEYRRRADVIVTTENQLLSQTNQISTASHDYYKKFTHGAAVALIPRLWHSVGGLALPDGEALYIGGADKDESRAPAVNKVPGAGTENTSQQNDNNEVNRFVPGKIDDIFNTMLASDLSHDELLALLDENNSSIQAEAGKEEFNHNYYQGLQRDQRIEALLPCPGLLSVVVSGEMASSRGLLQNNHDSKSSKVTEIHRVYTEVYKVDRDRFPYRLGLLVMDLELLKLMKQALLCFQPDGFYFSPSLVLAMDLHDIFSHIGTENQKVEPNEKLFAPEHLETWGASVHGDEDREKIYRTLVLLNELHGYGRSEAHVHFSVSDIKVVSKAVAVLKDMIAEWPHASDISWALIFHPKLLRDLLHSFKVMRIEEILAGKMTVTYKPELKPSHRQVTWNAQSELYSEGEMNWTYNIPLMLSDGQENPTDNEAEFDGLEVLVAYMQVLITHFWIERRWASNISRYESTIPQTVIMC